MNTLLLDSIVERATGCPGLVQGISVLKLIVELYILQFYICWFWPGAPRVRSEDETISDENPKVEENIGKAADASRTDDEVVQR